MVAIVLSDKIDFKAVTVTRDQEWHFIVIKGSIEHEDTTLVTSMHPA